MELLLVDVDRKRSKKVRRGMLGPTSPLKTRGRLSDRIRRKRFDQGQGQDILEDETPEEPAIYVVREGTALVTYTNAQGQAIKKTVGVGGVFGDEHLDGGQTSQRPADYSAKTAGDGPVSVGILSMKEVQRVHDELDNPPVAKKDEDGRDQSSPTKPYQDPNEVAIVSTASLRLLKKIRDAVHANIRLEDLEKISVLGEGQYGEVWLVAADVFQTGVDSLKQRFALKSQYQTDDVRGEEALEAIHREIDLLESLTQSSPHPGIVNLVQTYQDDHCIYMLMGLIPGGELWSRMHQEDSEGNWSSGLPEDAAKFYTYVVADTLGFIHAQHILFRDLKPENIMLDEDGYPVLVDFGFAKRIQEGERTFTFCGTPNYVAPEIILHSGHDKAVDYWGLGVTMYEMVTGENPFYYEGMDQVSLYDAICREVFYAYPKEPSPAMLELTHQLLEKEPMKRLGSLAGGFHDILNHKWFAGCWTLTEIRNKTVAAPWKPHSDKSGGDASETPGTDELDDEAMEDLIASFQATPVFAPIPSEDENEEDDNDNDDDNNEEEDETEQQDRRRHLLTPNVSSNPSLGIAGDIHEEKEQEERGDNDNDNEEEDETEQQDRRRHLLTPNVSRNSSLGIAGDVHEEKEQEERGDGPDDSSSSSSASALLDDEETEEVSLNGGDDEDDDDDVTDLAVTEDVTDKDAAMVPGELKEEELDMTGASGDRTSSSSGSGLLTSSFRRNKTRLTRRAKEKVKNERRSTIKGALAGLGLGDSQGDIEFDLDGADTK